MDAPDGVTSGAEQKADSARKAAPVCTCLSRALGPIPGVDPGCLAHGTLREASTPRGAGAAVVGLTPSDQFVPPTLHLDSIADEHASDATGREDTYGQNDDIVRCTCGEWEWDGNDNASRERWAEHVATATRPTPHRINIEEALTHTGWELSDIARADLLVVLYAWRDEAVTNAVRAERCRHARVSPDVRDR